MIYMTSYLWYELSLHDLSSETPFNIMNEHLETVNIDIYQLQIIYSHNAITSGI